MLPVASVTSELRRSKCMVRPPRPLADAVMLGFRATVLPSAEKGSDCVLTVGGGPRFNTEITGFSTTICATGNAALENLEWLMLK
jgi:hypothetical protein